MEKKKGLSIVLLIPTVIIAAALYKLFDFESLKFDNLGLAVVYIFTLAFLIFSLIRNTAKPKEE